MSLQLYINGVDRSSLILWPSTSWNPALNNEVDTITFQYQKFGSRSFTPANLDEVLLYDNGVKVFGGNIIKIDKGFFSGIKTIYTILAKDYSHIMDRRLVAEKYHAVPVINIISELLNRYINKKKRVEIATFEPTEIWSGGTADTANYITETQGRKLTSAGTLVSMSRTIFLDLTQYSLGSSDYIDVDVFIDNYLNLSVATIKLGDTTLSNYFSKNITSQITKNGWNHIHVLRSAFSSTGSPSFAAINFIQLEVTAVAATTVNVTFDNMQAISASAFTRNNSMDALQVVESITFKYEYPSKCIQQLADLFQWQWYVDQDKDIHFFAKFTELSPFNLSDTGAKYIPNSLRISDNVDQLRNGIFVRGGQYLDSSITEDLGHQVDGLNKIFKLGYKYSLETATLTLNSVEKALGQEGLDQFSDNQAAVQTSKGLATLNVGDVSGNTKQSLEIICPKKGRRTKIKIRIKKVGTPADNFQVQAFSDDESDKPSATNLSSIATLAGGSIGATITEYTFTLTESSTNTLLLNKNAKYHIVASRSGANDASNYYQIDVYQKVYDGFCYSGTSAPVWTATAYSWYFVEVVGYEAIYNIDQKIITFSTAPPNGNTLTLAGQPYKAVFIQLIDNTSITTYDDFEFKIEDSTILTKEAARQRALQEILAWASEASEAEFRTYETGLRVGQTINIQSDAFGIDEDYIISKINARARTGTAFEYTVTLITTKTFGILYWFQQQLQTQDKNTIIDDTEVLDKLQGYNESINFTDTTIAITLFVGHVWSNDAGTTPNKLIWSGGASHIWV